MMSDLRNLKILAWFLQKFELNFDILSSLKELSRQIKGEFDFRWADKALFALAIVVVVGVQRPSLGRKHHASDICLSNFVK